jgi:hypothetical protein
MQARADPHRAKRKLYYIDGNHRVQACLNIIKEHGWKHDNITRLRVLHVPDEDDYELLVLCGANANELASTIASTVLVNMMTTAIEEGQDVPSSASSSSRDDEENKAKFFPLSQDINNAAFWAIINFFIF